MFSYVKIFTIIPILLTIFLINEVHCENILIATFFIGKSAQILVDPLWAELSNRGHKLTIITSYPASQNSTNTNIRYIQTPEVTKSLKLMQKTLFEVRLDKGVINLNPFGPDLGTVVDHICKANYESSKVMDLIGQKFDLVITSSFLCECAYGLISKLQYDSLMLYSPIPTTWWTNSIFGNGHLTSYIPLIFSDLSHDMNFFERFKNFYFHMYFAWVREFQYIPRIEALYRGYLGMETKSIHDVEKDINMVLIDSDVSSNYPQPYMNGMIDIGGMHMSPAQPLPKDLQDFLKDTDTNGFIFFSMGSIVQGSTMPENIRRTFIKVFSRLKQKVIWKWESEVMLDLPKNVKLVKWAPQQDLLGHKNIKMFITHGGLGSTKESIYHGCPLIGIPLFGDQDYNMAMMASKGFGLSIEFREISEEILDDAINKILTDPRYHENARKSSEIFRDQPDKPLERAVFWTEYAIRHKGAKHFKSPAAHMNLAQLYSLDVLAMSLLIILIPIYILILCIAKMCKGSSDHKSPSKSLSKKKKL